MRLSALSPLLALVACGRSGFVSTTSPNGGGGGGGGSGGGVVTATLSVTPASVTLPPNGKQQFSANRPVSWSIGAAGGGSIYPSGSYTAPPTPGSYTVAAAATDGTGLTATAEVTVRPWRLEVLAGTLGGAGDADDSGSRARFSQPQQLAFDSTGALYIADAASYAVRKLDAKSGTVTTIAKSQLLAYACGIALDGSGNLFVSTQTGLINRVSIADGSIVTVSGMVDALNSNDGPAATATFFTPCGLSWDSGRQRLYIADNLKGIRVYDQVAARVSTLVSSGGRWAGVAFAGGNELYGSTESMIAHVDVSSGQLTALAYGSGYADGVGNGGHFTGGGQVALDLDNNALYVADSNVRKLDLDTRLVTTIGPRDFAWDGPGIAFDGAGGLYVTSWTGNAILHESVSGGERSIVAGLPSAVGAAAWVDGNGTAARFAAPSALTYDGHGALFVADIDNSVVRRVDVASGAVSTLAGVAGDFDRDGVDSAGRLISPSRAVADGSGGYVVVESSSHTVRRWNPASNGVTTLAGVYGVPGIDDGIGNQARFDEPSAICVLGGAVFVADTRSRTLRKIDLASAAVSTVAGSPETVDVVDGIGGAARFYEPIDVACDGARTVYVLESTGAVRRFDTVTGRVSTLAYAGNYAQALAIDAAHAYVAVTTASPLIKRISLADGTIDTIAGPAMSGVLVNLATDGAGNLYTASRFGTLYRIAADGTSTTLANPQGYFGNIDGPLATATFGSELGLTWDNGTLLDAETTGDKLRRIDLQAGVVSTVQGQPGQYWPAGGQGTSAPIGQPLGVALEGSQLYVTCAGLVAIDTGSADVTVLAPNSSTPKNSVDRPNGIVSDGNGHLYYSDQYLSVVDRFDVGDGSLHVLAGNPGQRGSSDGVGSAATFFYPEGVALDAGTLYVADSWKHTIRAVRLSDGNVTTFAGRAGSPGSSDGSGSNARFNGPTALVTDGDGGLLVADSGNGLIRRVDLASSSVTTVIGVAGQNGVLTGDLPARLNHPRGIALLPGGSLAISDEQAILVLR